MATHYDTGRVPGWYWAVALAALLWNGFGCFMYVSQVGMDAAEMARLPEVQQEVWRAMPAWAVGAYAIAVWAGLLGAIGLLLRRLWARLAFAASLTGVVVQFGWTFLGSRILAEMGPSAAI
ncbi:MAG TPA: hypothetical protein VK403_01270, partial [Allosphingosinicella sp.]|nr:hypothetical protein [Allosphingosinicella sp.]